jgi:hypothetical protein
MTDYVDEQAQGSPQQQGITGIGGSLRSVSKSSCVENGSMTDAPSDWGKGAAAGRQPHQSLQRPNVVVAPDATSIDLNTSFSASAVPLALVQHGDKTTSSRAGDTSSGGGRAREALQQLGLAEVTSFMTQLLRIEGTVQPRLVLACLALRAFLIPAVGFALIHFCVTQKLSPSIADPTHNTLLLVLFLEVAAPSAINTAVLFSSFQYSVKPFAKVLLYLYINALWSVVAWMCVAVWYVS